MGRGTIRINLGELGGQDDSVTNFLTRIAFSFQFLGWYDHAGLDDTSIGQVGQNPEKHTTFRQGFDICGDFLTHRINDVCTHGIAGINEDMNDQHQWVSLCSLEGSYFDVLNPAPAFNHLWVKLIEFVDEFVFMEQNLIPGFLRIRWIHDLDLANEKGFL